VTTTASIGVVPYRGDIAGPDTMMMKADLALYRVKNEGATSSAFTSPNSKTRRANAW
jgi:GGDEF domain-containing protein